jgi:isoleucyl-tRNA synthetase
MGIPAYNEACRGIVLKYSSEWERIVTRLGRWIDFQNDYKTMDVKFMESVWWVFKQIYDKGYVYQGFKVILEISIIIIIGYAIFYRVHNPIVQF